MKMPSASAAKVEKLASSEGFLDPLKQGITLLEKKIRNLEKRKLKLEKYQEEQSSGKELNSDQLLAVSKYDEVQLTLEFSRDLCKNFNGIVAENAKQQKKQARKEALEKTQQDVARVKEILVIQDVLANMGQDNIREDFLAGNNKACKLSEEVLQQLDDLYTEVSPKREVEEGQPPFVEQLNKAAEHLLCITEGKNKEIVGTTYAQLKKQINEISTCGYFDSSSEEPVTATPEVDVDAALVAETAVAPAEDEFEPEDEESLPVETTTFQPSKVVAQIEQEQPIPVAASAPAPAPHNIVPVPVPIIPPQQPANEVISNVISTVGNSSFHFLQESELDKPDVGATPTAPPPSALPIPSQSFKKQNFVAGPLAAQPQPQPPQPQPLQPQPQPTQPAYSQMAIANQQLSYGAVAYVPPPPNTFHPQQTHVMVEEIEANPPAEVSEWNESVSVPGKAMENSDWNSQCDEWQESTNQQQSSDNWSNDNQQNDGFVTAGVRSSGRGPRVGRVPRGDGGGFESPGRTGGGGGSNYHRNNYDNTYYQSNGFQNRSGDNYRNDNRRGGSGPRGGSSRSNQERSGGNFYRNNSDNSHYQSNGYQNRGGEGGNFNRRGSGPRGPGSSRPNQERGGPRGGGGGRGGGRGGNRQ